MAPTTRIAVFPGSFDPPTLGHLDLIQRASRLFDRVVVALLRNTSKQPMFPLDERAAMLRSITADLPGVEVEVFDGLLVDYARRRGAVAIVRGVRNSADLGYELELAGTNRHLDDAIDTLFLAPAGRYAHISSTLVREIAGFGGPVRGLVPPAVEPFIEARRHPARVTRA
jgi:pantetheine-phosphate adenylyltransferase